MFFNDRNLVSVQPKSIKCGHMTNTNVLLYVKTLVYRLINKTCLSSECNHGAIERFSFECRKVIGFAFVTLHDWLKKFAPLFHPIRSKTKTNRDSLARVFPRFSQLHVITWSFDWFTVLCVFFVIG